MFCDARMPELTTKGMDVCMSYWWLAVFYGLSSDRVDSMGGSRILNAIGGLNTN